MASANVDEAAEIITRAFYASMSTEMLREMLEHGKGFAGQPAADALNRQLEALIRERGE